MLMLKRGGLLINLSPSWTEVVAFAWPFSFFYVAISNAFGPSSSIVGYFASLRQGDYGLFINFSIIS